MTLVFDTSALSPLLSNDDRIVRALSQMSYDRWLVPLAVDAELRYGFAHGSKQAENLSNYEKFKQQFNLEVVPPDQDTAVVYAELATWSRERGVALSHNDIWVAATCVQFGARLIALHQDFAQLPQLRMLHL